jgi:hypothetical protein
MKNPAIVDELKRLAEQNGGDLKPKAVVTAARHEDSPLHNQFDWEDSAAADKWRLHQARQLINAVVSYEKLGDGTEVAVRVFVSLTPDREAEDGGYRVVSTVMSDADLRRQLLADALAEMKRFQAKYRDLHELSKVFAALDEVKEHEELSATA